MPSKARLAGEEVTLTILVHKDDRKLVHDAAKATGAGTFNKWFQDYMLNGMTELAKAQVDHYEKQKEKWAVKLAFKAPGK